VNEKACLRPIPQPLYSRCTIDGSKINYTFFDYGLNRKGDVDIVDFGMTNMIEPNQLRYPFEFDLGQVGILSSEELDPEFIRCSFLKFYLSTSKPLFNLPLALVNAESGLNAVSNELRDNLSIANRMSDDTRTALADWWKGTRDETQVFKESFNKKIGVRVNIGKLRFKIRPTEWFGAEIDTGSYKPKTPFDVWCILGGILWSPL
jgi:hypothetical protein